MHVWRSTASHRGSIILETKAKCTSDVRAQSRHFDTRCALGLEEVVSVNSRKGSRSNHADLAPHVSFIASISKSKDPWVPVLIFAAGRCRRVMSGGSPWFRPTSEWYWPLFVLGELIDLIANLDVAISYSACSDKKST